MKRITTVMAALLSAALLGGCRDGGTDGPGILTGDPDITPVNEILGTAVPLAKAAVLAMAKMRGEDIPCVAVTAQCASYPCSGSVTITVDTLCALPLGSVGNGVIVVSGNWTSDSTAALVAVFEGVAIDGAGLFVRQGAFTATMAGDTMTVVYADQSVDVTVSRAGIEQSLWTVSVATQGTLGNVRDDAMVINGGRRYVAGTAISDVVLVDVGMSGACTRNPVDGTATVYAGGVGSLDFTQLDFHSDCDGNAVVTASIYVQWIGDEIPLDLLN